MLLSNCTVCLFSLQGRIAFGNKLLETTLCFKFESATGVYTTSQVCAYRDIMKLTNNYCSADQRTYGMLGHVNV